MLQQTLGFAKQYTFEKVSQNNINFVYFLKKYYNINFINFLRANILGGNVPPSHGWEFGPSYVYTCEGGFSTHVSGGVGGYATSSSKDCLSISALL